MNNTYRKSSSFVYENTPLQMVINEKTKWSIEIYPPKLREDYNNLIALLREYQKYGITHVNVTGKVGNNERTFLCVENIRNTIPSLRIVPHIVSYKLSCSDLKSIVKKYYALEITDMFVVRGDVPFSEEKNQCKTEGFLYASDVVKQIKDMSSDIRVGVAGYPSGHYEQHNFLEDIKYLKDKVNAGADYIITQMFFSNYEYFDFVKRCKLFNITVPIIPGITRVKNAVHIEKLAKLALGSIIPADLLSAMYKVRETEKEGEVKEKEFQIGKKWLMQQIHDLRKCIATIHLYVFNSKSPFIDIISQCNAHSVF